MPGRCPSFQPVVKGGSYDELFLPFSPLCITPFTRSARLPGVVGMSAEWFRVMNRRKENESNESKVYTDRL
jgi:hypothetical protein